LSFGEPSRAVKANRDHRAPLSHVAEQEVRHQSQRGDGQEPER
jgi:hypothetical protein